MGDAERANRAARREFIRRSHPDRGGDPALFVDGLARFDTQHPGATRVVIVPARRWPVNLLLTVARVGRQRRARPRVH